MYLTEEEAKKKWCPQVRANERGVLNRAFELLKRLFGFNKDADHNPDHFNCIASECMMWRERRGHRPDTLEEVVEYYCGLGGKP